MQRWVRSALMSVLFAASPALAAPDAPAAAPDAEAARLQSAGTFAFRNGVKLKLYGKIEMLTYFDTTVPAVSDWCAYVERKGTPNGTNDSFSMSVRASPVGLHLAYPAFPDWTLNARMEMDFVGGYLTGTSSVYSPLARLKQAWVSLDHPNFSVMAGQSFSVFGPLMPDTANWIVLGTAGNPWIRLPQIRLTGRIDPVQLEVSVNRPMAANEVFSDSVNDIISDGELSRMPLFMGRLGYRQTLGPVSIAAGIGGAFGRERVFRGLDDTPATQTTVPDGAGGQKTVPDVDGPRVGLVDKGRIGTGSVTALDRTVDLWLASADLKIGTKYVDVLGEFFAGANLNTFYAGIIQGITIFERIESGKAAYEVRSVRSMGGWGQVTVRPYRGLSISLGGGVDKPRASDLALPSAAARSDGKAAAMPRSSNVMAFGGVTYRIADLWLVGLEANWTRTAYLDDAGTNANWRGVLKTSFSF